MIRALVDFALNNRFVVLAIGLLLAGWGAISFHNLPVEAYPDIADNYVTVITQWPGRAAEEVEQQVTIPIEIQMNGIPHLSHLRSESIFGLSFVLRDLRRQLGQRLEPPEGARAAQSGRSARWRVAFHGHGLEPDRSDLLVHAEEHESHDRFDGPAVDPGLDDREGTQVRSRHRRCQHLWRHDARIPGARRSRTSSCPTA